MEGFNSAWNESSTISSSVWVSIEHIRKDYSLSMAYWREETMMVEQRLANTEDPGSSCNIDQQNKIAKLKNVCSQYNNYEGDLRAEYFNRISAIL